MIMVVALINQKRHDLLILSYDVASESVIKPCIKNDNQLVD